MNKEDFDKIEELLDDSLETLADKKRFSKTMRQILKDSSKEFGVDIKALKAVKDYHHYKGANWLDGNPLKKDSEKKEKDKISSVLIKLVEIVNNLREVGDSEFLNPYLEALAQNGIKIEIDFDDNDKYDSLVDVIGSASKLQTNVDTLVEELKESKSTEAEELNFTPKSSFVGVLGLLDKIKSGKNMDDKIQSNFTELAMLNNAFSYLSAKNEEYKDSLEE